MRQGKKYYCVIRPTGIIQMPQSDRTEIQESTKMCPNDIYSENYLKKTCVMEVQLVEGIKRSLQRSGGDMTSRVATWAS